MILGRITADRQLDIPEAVLEALGLRPGDPVAFVIDCYGEVTLGRADDPFINPLATFTEWASAADSEAYDNL